MKATDKQCRWITHWLKERNMKVSDYISGKFLSKLTKQDAGYIIGKAREAIKNLGYESTEAYIEEVHKRNGRQATLPQQSSHTVVLKKLGENEIHIFKGLVHSPQLAISYLASINKLVVE